MKHFKSTLIGVKKMQKKMFSSNWTLSVQNTKNLNLKVHQISIQICTILF